MNKICTNCNEIKEFFDFYKDKKGKYGLSSICKICSGLKHKKYYKNNKNHIIKKVREWQKKNYEIFIEKNFEFRKFYVKSGRKVDILRKWRKNNKEKVYEHRHNRRAKIKKLGKIDKYQIQFALMCSGYSCSYCGVDVSERYSIDHIIPINKYGKNELWNLAISCITCNSSKGDRNVLDWELGKVKFTVNLFDFLPEQIV